MLIAVSLRGGTTKQSILTLEIASLRSFRFVLVKFRMRRSGSKLGCAQSRDSSCDSDFRSLSSGTQIEIRARDPLLRS